MQNTLLITHNVLGIAAEGGVRWEVGSDAEVVEAALAEGARAASGGDQRDDPVTGSKPVYVLADERDVSGGFAAQLLGEW